MIVDKDTDLLVCMSIEKVNAATNQDYIEGTTTGLHREAVAA
jgi:hypothetical protein